MSIENLKTKDEATLQTYREAVESVYERNAAAGREKFNNEWAADLITKHQSTIESRGMDQAHPREDSGPPSPSLDMLSERNLPQAENSGHGDSQGNPSGSSGPGPAAG